MLPPSTQDAAGWHLRIPVDGNEGLCVDALAGVLPALWALGLAVGMFPPSTPRVRRVECWFEERKGWWMFCGEVTLC